MTRFTGHRILAGVIEVYGYAQTIPEALAIETAIKSVPRGEAFVPPDPPEPSPEVLALIERAEVDGSDFGLKAGEAHG